MTTSNLVPIATYPNATEAELVRIVLDEHDIQAFVDGANTNTVMSHIAIGLGGVHVLVRDCDAERAAAVIDAVMDDVQTPPEPWFCGRCQVAVEGNFDVCWSCGQPRADVEAPMPAAEAAQHPAEPVHQPARGRADYAWDGQNANPYAAPRSSNSSPESGRDDDAPENEQAEARLVRAWRAAVIGLAVFPFSIYSMYLLVRAGAMTSNFSPRGRTRFFWALALYTVSSIIWVGFLAGTLG